MIGETTYGTGTVLSEFVLRDGSSILLGVAEWLTPDGDFIRETGIEPDVKVPLKEGAEQITPDGARDLRRPQAADLDVGGDPDPEVAALGAQRRLLLAQRVVADVRERLASMALNVSPSGTDEMKRQLEADAARWEKLAQELDIKPLD